MDKNATLVAMAAVYMLVNPQAASEGPLSVSELMDLQVDTIVQVYGNVSDVGESKFYLESGGKSVEVAFTNIDSIGVGDSVIASGELDGKKFIASGVKEV